MQKWRNAENGEMQKWRNAEMWVWELRERVAIEEKVGTRVSGVCDRCESCGGRVVSATCRSCSRCGAAPRAELDEAEEGRRRRSRAAATGRRGVRESGVGALALRAESREGSRSINRWLIVLSATFSITALSQCAARRCRAPPREWLSALHSTWPSDLRLQAAGLGHLHLH